MLLFKRSALLAAVVFTCTVGCDGPGQDEFQPSSDRDPETISNSDDDRVVRAIVSLPDGASSFSPGAAVYVFARTPGSSMPLAVEKFFPNQLPIEVGFSQPQPGIDLIEVVARLSRNGDVRFQTGDMEIVSPPIEFSATPKVLRLDIRNESPESFVHNVESIHIDVQLSASEVVTAGPDVPVFVIAKEASGLPIAVRKLTVADLPTTVRLSDAHSMFVTNKLSQHTEVNVVARIARSGQPIAVAGDWQGEITSVKPLELEGPLSIFIGTEIE